MHSLLAVATLALPLLSFAVPVRPAVTPPAIALTRDSGPPAVRAEILKMLDSSAAAWNRGDLDKFVGDYAPDSSTTYIGSRGIVRSRAAIKETYLSYFAPGKARDSLSFSLQDLDVLAPNVVNVIAHWRLSRGDSTISQGPTSLVMRKSGGKWRIIHDHSS